MRNLLILTSILSLFYSPLFASSEEDSSDDEMIRYYSLKTTTEFFELAERIHKRNHPEVEAEDVTFALDWDNTLCKMQIEKGQYSGEKILDTAKSAPLQILQRIELSYKVIIVTGRGFAFEASSSDEIPDGMTAQSIDCRLLSSLETWHKGMRSTTINTSASFYSIDPSPIRLESKKKGCFIPTYIDGCLFSGTEKLPVFEAFCEYKQYRPKVVFIFDDQIGVWNEEHTMYPDITYYFIKKID